MNSQRPRLDATARRVLRALFELAQLDCPAHAGTLGRALSISPVQIARVLVELDQQGLVCAGRSRLTMTGLLVASRLPALGLEPIHESRPAVHVPRRLRMLAQTRSQRPRSIAPSAPGVRAATQ